MHAYKIDTQVYYYTLKHASGPVHAQIRYMYCIEGMPVLKNHSIGGARKVTGVHRWKKFQNPALDQLKIKDL